VVWDGGWQENHNRISPASQKTQRRHRLFHCESEVGLLGNPKRLRNSDQQFSPRRPREEHDVDAFGGEEQTDVFRAFGSHDSLGDHTAAACRTIEVGAGKVIAKVQLHHVVSYGDPQITHWQLSYCRTSLFVSERIIYELSLLVPMIPLLSDASCVLALG